MANREADSPGSAYRAVICQPCRSHSALLALFCSSMLRARWISRRSRALGQLGHTFVDSRSNRLRPRGIDFRLHDLILATLR